MTVNVFLLYHLKVLSNYYDITVITNTNNPDFLISKGIPVKVITLNIERQIYLASDIKALFRLVKIIKQHQFASVHSVTPKAGLLAMIAAWLNKVPVRVHTFTGQVWVTKLGFKRLLLKSIDCFFGRLATHTMVDSPSQRDFLIAENVLNSEKCIVFGEGSISGVDLNRFKPNASKRRSLRLELGLPEEEVVCLFLGRLNVDKGLLDLAKAFISAESKLADRETVLLFIGPDEQGMQNQIEALKGSDSAKIRFIGYTEAPQDFMAAADLLCLPSYREGFGSVVIEAAAVGIPSLASRIYGITDAVKESETGLLHIPGDVVDIEDKLISLISDYDLRIKLGRLASERARTVFDSDIITQAWVDFYREQVVC